MRTRMYYSKNSKFKKITDVLAVIALVVLLFTYDFDFKLLILETGIILLLTFFMIGIGLIATRFMKDDSKTK
ncbi:MAG: hypothetical protein Q4D02_01445 [Clostridia bacterium]|nr:hypothetical protein [Clostridia bacterium]